LSEQPIDFTARRQHARFRERLEKSKVAVEAWARNLRRHGWHVTVPETQSGETPELSKQFSDRGDILAEKGWQREWWQVKNSSRNWTGRHDFPFKELYLSAPTWWEKNPHVHNHVTLTSDLQYYAAAFMISKEHWYIKEMLAGNTGNFELTWASPLSYVTFGRLLRG